MTSNHYNHFLFRHQLKDKHSIYNLMQHLETVIEQHHIALSHTAFHQALSFFKTTVIGGVVVRYSSDDELYKDIHDHAELYPILLNWYEAWTGSSSTIANAFEALGIVRSHHQAQKLHSITSSSSSKAARRVL